MFWALMMAFQPILELANLLRSTKDDSDSPNARALAEINASTAAKYDWPYFEVALNTAPN